MEDVTDVGDGMMLTARKLIENWISCCLRGTLMTSCRTEAMFSSQDKGGVLGDKDKSGKKLT
jgi:hypothetical protein